MSTNTITYITSNAQKLEEVQTIFGASFPRKVISLYRELPELQAEMDELCIFKCKEAAKYIDGPIILDMFSLCFNALHGLPGPYTKWFLNQFKPECFFQLLAGHEDKSAVAVCTFAYYDGDNSSVKLFHGCIEGSIVFPRGHKDLGWKCCFEPMGYEKTLAELPKNIPATLSHRSKAIIAMRDYFISYDQKE